ncbi:hypothetical protein [Pseudacidovorax sp. NFM-22]|uniref:hypothetical protein n=1 Tax=Pseudacidovorax sp. NFM-22 TaxID=2744469 RepID=UPI001F25AA01|nr:hypothetical protein [Pseudacidovorax sp. NFM-22]
MAPHEGIALRHVREGQLSGWKGAAASNAMRNAVVYGRTWANSAERSTWLPASLR